jgi:nicotinamide mononucleotide transporter
LDPVELIATVFGVACVWLYVRRSIWAWPVGLVQVCLYLWIFVHARLYSDVLLHVIYVFLQLYGWYCWGKPTRPDQGPRITRLGLRGWLGWGVVGSSGALLLGFTMHRLADATLPYADSAVAVFSLVAQYLLARRILENWLIWIGVDVLATGVYFTKGLYVTMGLYTVFLVMAYMGWTAWRKSYRAAVSTAAGGSSSASSSPRHEGTSCSSTSLVTTAVT